MHFAMCFVEVVAAQIISKLFLRVPFLAGGLAAAGFEKEK
jgi:hypothetical protein